MKKAIKNLHWSFCHALTMYPSWTYGCVCVCIWACKHMCVCVSEGWGVHMGYMGVRACVYVHGGGHPSMHLCSMRDIILVYEISKQKTTVHDIHIKLSEQHTWWGRKCHPTGPLSGQETQTHEVWDTPVAHLQFFWTLPLTHLHRIQQF